MSALRRIVLVRHGDTVGDSRNRLHGSNDVALSDAGREQMREVGRSLAREVFEGVVASPMRRSWEAARIVSGGAAVRLEAGLREIHFGRWEGLTKAEIEASDPVLYQDWQNRVPGFEFPGGEAREAFRARVLAGFAAVESSGAANLLLVVHKGVIRAIAEHLLGQPLPSDQPEIGAVVSLTRRAGGAWFPGRRGSNPEALAEVA